MVPFKLRSGNTSAFKNLGSSPAKQSMELSPELKKLKAERIANTKAGKIIKFGEGSNIIADKGPIDPWSSDKASKASKATKASKASKASKVIKNVGKVAKNIGKRFLGPVGAALTAHDVVKTMPKVAKATKKSLKKEAKERTATDLFKGPKY